MPRENVDSLDFLETADRIAHRLCRDAVWATDACTWLGWTTDCDWQRDNIVFAALGPDLYGGTAGISLFLSRYFRLCPSKQIEVVLRGAVQQALAGLSAMPASRSGFFVGTAGIAYAAIEAGVAMEDERLVHRGLAQLRDLPRAEETDVISGSAGVIPVLLDAANRFDHDGLLAAAAQHGEVLLNRAEKTDAGWSWQTMPGMTSRNATGFSHGTAGIATALLELFHQTGDESFLDAARQAWRYERTYFCREESNWPDFRAPSPGDAPRPCATKWCHGAVGIGLSRIRAWELGHHDAELAEEIEAAIKTTRAWLAANEEVSTDFSLCHGMAGNAELFIAAARVLDRPALFDVAASVGRSGVRQFERHGQPWPCGGPLAFETPDLMLGLAGIGLFYLRLHAPSLVESVLVVRPCPRNEGHSAGTAPRQ